MDLSELILQFIKPELVIVVVVLYILGMFLKNSNVKDELIPLVIGIVSIAISTLWVLSTSTITGFQEGCAALMTAIVQGILCAGGAVFSNQLFKQLGKTKEDSTDE